MKSKKFAQCYTIEREGAMTRWLLIALLLCALPAVSSAHSKVYAPSIDRLFTSQYVAAGTSATTTQPFYIGDSTIHGVDWVVTTVGSVNVTIEVLQSNSQAGPFTKWAATSAAGTTAVNTITINTAQGGSDLQLLPSGWGKYRITNNDAAAAVFTGRGMNQ